MWKEQVTTQFKVEKLRKTTKYLRTVDIPDRDLNHVALSLLQVRFVAA